MAVPSRVVTWVFDEDVSVATLLGLLSIPFTVALSLNTGPIHYDFSVVSVAALLSGLYYSNRSTAGARAGMRTGVIGGLPAAWESVSIAASGWAISPGFAALGIAFASLWLCFSLAACALLGAIDALIGNAIGRLPLFRRIGPKPA